MSQSHVFSQLLSPSPTGGTGWELEGLRSTFPRGICTACTQLRCSPCVCSKPASQQQLGRGGRGAQNSPPPMGHVQGCGGSWVRDTELGAACPCPAPLQPFLVGGEAAFATFSREKPAPGSSPLSLLEKEVFLCRKLLLENSPAAWEKLPRN